MDRGIYTGRLLLHRWVGLLLLGNLGVVLLWYGMVWYGLVWSGPVFFVLFLFWRARKSETVGMRCSLFFPEFAGGGWSGIRRMEAKMKMKMK